MLLILIIGLILFPILFKRNKDASQRQRDLKNDYKKRIRSRLNDRDNH